MNSLRHEQEAGGPELLDDHLVAIARQDLARCQIGHEFRHPFVRGENFPYRRQRRLHRAAGNSDEEISSPLYATAVGLVMNSIENHTQSAVRMDVVETPKAPVYRAPVVQKEEIEEPANEVESQSSIKKEESTETKIRRSFFDRYVDKIKDFLDNAE